MALNTIRGRSLQQWADVLLARSSRSWRRIRLSQERRRLTAAEASWQQDPGEVIGSLTEIQAREVLRRHPEAWPTIQESADLALSGWVNVPGFGRGEIALNHPQEVSPEEAYAYRLLARLDFLESLSRGAFIASEPTPYLNAIDRHLIHWGDVRGGRDGWDSVDDAIRILNLLDVLAWFRDKLSPKVVQSSLRTIIDQAWNVEINRTRTGNHLIYEGLALLAVGLGLPTYPRSTVWRNLGRGLLEKQMYRQVRDDGLHGELCTNYHLITGTNFSKGWIWASKGELPFSDDYSRKLLKMMLVARQLQAIDGSFIALGDSDRLTGDSREERQGRAFAELGGFLSSAVGSRGNRSLELDWLLGGTDLQRLDLTEKPTTEEIQSFGGYQTRSGGNWRLIFDLGPFGLPGASHHAHADSLSFELHVRGRRFLVDPGGFSYVDQQARSFARSTAAHNTIRVNGQDSSQITGSFSFGRGAVATCRGARRMGSGFLILGEQKGYAPVLHRRGIYLDDQFPGLIVFDRIEGSGKHRCEAFFHADANWQVEPQVQHSYLWKDQELTILQQILCSVLRSDKIVTAQHGPEWQGWVAPEYGHYQPAPVLIIECTAELPVDLVNIFTVIEKGKSWKLRGDHHTLWRNDKPWITWRWTPHDLELTVSEEPWN